MIPEADLKTLRDILTHLYKLTDDDAPYEFRKRSVDLLRRMLETYNKTTGEKPQDAMDQPLEDIKTEYDDDTPMPFGKYKGEPLSDIPASYFHWLWSNKPISDKALEGYIRRNLNALKREHPDGIWS